MVMKMQESGENYLETILILQNQKGFVRSIDIAKELNYTKASISRAMSILKKAGYIMVAENREILLTEKGSQKANEVYERHTLISKFLVNTLGVDTDTADTDACRIEHIISQKSFDRIKALYDNEK